MTGVGQMMAAGGRAAAAPFAASAVIQGGNSSVSVTTASGSTTAIPGGGERFFFVTVSGGTWPYTYKWERQNAEGKTALESTNAARAYVSWEDMIVGEYSSTTARCKVTDANGNVAYTNTHVIGVTRVS